MYRSVKDSYPLLAVPSVGETEGSYVHLLSSMYLAV
jgi:hypothetical protein